MFGSCSKLDLVPTSTKSTEGFYKTEAHINQAVIGLYAGLKTVWVTSQASYMLTEARSDNAFQGTAYNDGPISRFEETPELPVLYDAWTMYYNYIQRANTLISSLPNVAMDATLKNQYEAEARFARAMFYFDLVRIFGGVPVVKTPLTIEESYGIGRSSVKEVYSFIIEDLTYAISNLPQTYQAQNKGRVTSWAAKGYLGKVYLFTSGYPLKENNWNKSISLFKEIMDSGQFEFFENYSDIYSYNFEGGKQQLFSILFKAGSSGNGNPYPTRNASNDIAPIPFSEGGIPFGGSPFNLFLSQDVVNSYEPGDLRKEVSILSVWKHKSGSMISTLPTARKYQNGPVIGANDWDIDWIALSYTDVIMMYAECLNELSYSSSGEAFQILNKIRKRAGLAPKTGADYPNQQAFRLWMEKERRMEFTFENLRWYDLVRTDRALPVLKEFLSDYQLADRFKDRNQYLYPIPQTVRNITPNIEQNPGY